MKALYIYSTNDKDYQSNGESKKVLSQVSAFKNARIEVEFMPVILEGKRYKILYRLPFYGIYSKSVITKCKNIVKDFDFVFIRKNIFDNTYLNLLFEIRKKNPKIKIFVEIPTYPYFQEWNRLIDKPLIWKEKRIIPKVAKNKLVDYYLTLTEDSLIFDIPTIKFDNCVSVDNYSPKVNVQGDENIHLIGVALLAQWHGYDRVIEGLYNYYKSGKNKVRVYFHVVGKGSVLKNLISLTEQRNMTEYVSFEGVKSGEELDQMYNKSQIAVGCLGLYRKGLIKANALKSREYCAKGIPFINAGCDSVFEGFKYTLTFPNDDSPIDINKVVDFAAGINFEVATKEMREFAKKNLDWNKFVSDIVAKI